MIKDHFLSSVYRLREMKRFAIRQVNRNISPAEHSWFVAVLGLYIGWNSTDHEYDVSKVMARSILHDVPEAITSDIPYFIKHHNKKAIDMFRFIEDRIVNEVYTFGMAPDAVSKFQDAILNCKDDSKEGQLVALCDLMEALWYVTEERIRGNQNKWIDEVYNQLIDMIAVNNAKLNESLVKDIVDYLQKQFGPSQRVRWSDLLGGGYDKEIPQESNNGSIKRGSTGTRTTSRGKARPKSRS